MIIKLAGESDTKKILSLIKSANNNDQYRNINFLSPDEWLKPRMYRMVNFSQEYNCYIIWENDSKNEDQIEGVLITNKLNDVYKLTSLSILNLVYRKGKLKFTKEIFTKVFEDTVTKLKIGMPQESEYLTTELGLELETTIKFEIGESFIYSLFLKEDFIE